MEFQDLFLLISVMWFISLFGKVCRIFLYLGDNIGHLVAFQVYKLLLKQKFMSSMLINVVFSF
jgi:uncharacterized protein YqhQ